MKHKIFALLLVLVMLIGLIPFTATEVHAVEVDALTGETTFTEGDEVLIVNTTSSEAKTSENKAIYTYTGGKWVPTSGTLVWEKDKKNTFKAYYPATVDFTLPTDQSEKAKLNAADRMVGSAEGDPGESLSFTLSHTMSRVTFRVAVIGTEFDSDDKITALKVVTNDGIEVTACAEGQNYTAIINSNWYTSADDIFVKVYMNEGAEPLTVKVPAKFVGEEGGGFQSGTHYTFSLKVGKNKLTLTPVAANDGHPSGWNTEVNLDGSTGTIGTANAGKTAWENGDKILVHLYSQKYEDQAGTLTFENNSWIPDGGTLSYLENEIPTITAVYAPVCKISENNIVLNDNQMYGMSEYIHATTKIEGNGLRITFEDATRDYSRLRIVGLPNQTLTVTTTGFTPAGASAAADGTTYTVTTNGDGNAFLYGTFAEGATVSVKYGNVVLKDYTFTAENNPNGTEQGKSYALDARPVIDGTLGGKATATEDDIKALVEQIKYYVDNGISTIIVTGSEPAIIDMGTYTNTAIGEAIYRLSKEESYYGKIDLILSDVTEIIGYEFQNAYALNSITLPNVTQLGSGAFYGCLYLKKIIFGSVVVVKEGSPHHNDFMDVGTAVGGCHLVLNREQVNAATEYQPDGLEKKWWAGTQWNYIELI